MIHTVLKFLVCFYNDTKVVINEWLILVLVIMPSDGTFFQGFVIYRAQNEAYKIEKTKKWEKSMNDRELER